MAMSALVGLSNGLVILSSRGRISKEATITFDLKQVGKGKQ